MNMRNGDTNFRGSDLSGPSVYFLFCDINMPELGVT